FPILRENLTKIDQAIVDIEEKVEGKAPSKHTHSISEITDLEAALKGKMSADKTFSFADLSDIEGAQDAANNYVLYKSSNNNFTFGSAVSLLGSHQHKIEDIVGLDKFRAKLNEDLTSYGHLTSPNEWRSYNKFTSKVTMSGGLELLGNSSFNLIHNNKVVSSLNTTGSMLKGPLKVDGAEVYSKNEALVALQEIRDEITKLRKATSPLEILMTESGTIPFPEGMTDNTEIEIWAWGGGGGGGDGAKGKSSYGGGGGSGGQSVYVKIKASQLKSAKIIEIGRGGRGASPGGGGGGGGYTRIEGIITAYGGPGGGGGGGGSGGVSSFNGSFGGDASSNGYRGSSFIYAGGNGGNGGSGHGGNSFFGGGGGGGAGANNGNGGYGGESHKGGRGGKGCKGSGQGGGGGGGYFPGEDGGVGKGGNGGNGAVLLRFFI
uniref:Bgr_08870 family protein n=1 Tax=Bartonella sp. PS7NMGDW TaxID=3243574 RepID=UPI0035CF65D4